MQDGGNGNRVEKIKIDADMELVVRFADVNLEIEQQYIKKIEIEPFMRDSCAQACDGCFVCRGVEKGLREGS